MTCIIYTAFTDFLVFLDTDDEMQWLKYNRDPWPLVEQKWKASCTYRKINTYDSDKTLAMMVNEWPCLKTTNGHRLVMLLFTFKYMSYM